MTGILQRGAARGNLLAIGIPLGRTHGEMLHQNLRNFVGDCIRKKVKPNVILKVPATSTGR